jgi:hypothetical protein
MGRGRPERPWYALYNQWRFRACTSPRCRNETRKMWVTEPGLICNRCHKLYPWRPEWRGTV